MRILHKLFLFQLKKELEGWHPLTSPLLCHNVVSDLRDILEDQNKFKQKNTQMDPYDRLIWDVIMPHIRTLAL